jgi:4-methyl-5(b-hydroxyethyl)-thiazole monophosphate biosynthesis
MQLANSLVHDIIKIVKVPLKRSVIMSKVFIFLADGFEEIEGLTVVDLLRRAGIEISMVSVTGTKEIIGSHNIKIGADELFEEVDFSEAAMLILPGGMPGTNHLAAHQGLVNLLKQFNQEGKKLAAICAAPSVLGINGILRGKKVTCYPGYEEKLIGATATGSKIETDSNIITGKGMGVSIDFALSIIESLKDLDTADKIAEAIQYK